MIRNCLNFYSTCIILLLLPIVICQVSSKPSKEDLMGGAMWPLGYDLDKDPGNNWNFTDKPYVLEANGTKHTATIIFLHSMGQTGPSMRPVLNYFRKPYMKVILPTANVIPVTMKWGEALTTWYDIHPRWEYGDVERAAKYIHGIINDEIKKGIPSERIMLGGFAQGGGLALYCAQMFPKKLAGYIGFCKWPLSNKETDKPLAIPTPANKDLPIINCRDDQGVDPMYVPIYRKFTKYHGSEHPISEEQMKQVDEFLKTHLGDK